MIVWRAIQGFIGGGMVPTVFASAYLIFQGPRQKLIAPVVGLIATLAPTIGPTVGGYLTDAYSWHWLFFINVVPGIVVTAVTAVLVDFDKPDLALLKNFDWYGLLSMAGFLGALEYVLEEGPRYEWFDDDTIFVVAIVSALSAIVFFARVLTARAPIVDLRAFANRNFAVGSLFSFVLGIGLYGLTYLYPVYLAPDARLRRADDRRDHVRLRPGHVRDRADRRPAGRKIRSAAHPRFGLRLLCHRHLADDLSHGGLGFLGTAVAASVPRRRADVRDHTGHQYLARNACRRSG